MSARRRILLLVLLVSVGAVLLVAVWLWRVTRQVTDAPEPFDATAWKAARVGGPGKEPACVRGGMALDLVQRQTLSGMSGPQVVALLGAPDEQGPAAWTYHLGECPGWGWNDSDLRLSFDAGSTRVRTATFEHVAVPESR